MRKFLLQFFFLFCLITALYSTVSFVNIEVLNVDGGVQVNFTLNTTVSGIPFYIIFTECAVVNSTANATNMSDISNPNCTAFPVSTLQHCCDSCVTTNWASVTVEGPLTAGTSYSCSSFGIFGGVMAGIEANTITASTGIPSTPVIEFLAPQDNGSVFVGVQSTYLGGGDSSTWYRILIQNDTNTMTIHDCNYTATNFEITNIKSGDYNMSAWAINRYGSSTQSWLSAFTVNVTIAANEEDDSKSNTGAVIAAIAGGVAAGIIVLVVVAVVISVIVVVLVFRKPKPSKAYT